MHLPRISLAVVVSLLAAGPALAADKYTIDRVHTFIGFSARHMMVSHVRGRFTDFSGEILLDEEDLPRSSVNVVIKAASINTNHEKRDSDLRGAEFLNVEQFPEITFKSKRIEKSNGGYVAIGDLTIRDVTKEIALPFTLAGPIAGPGGRKRLGADSEITINRHDYGVSWNKVMETGGLIVGPEVKIELNVEAVEFEPPSAP